MAFCWSLPPPRRYSTPRAAQRILDYFSWRRRSGQGKHVVLISGDEEYRSEEALPQLAKILSQHHGFQCTVVFAIDPKDGSINPKQSNNVPGLEALDKADLMIIATRFRDLPDDQMKHVVDYTESGRPIIGMRTATHAFNLNGNSKYVKILLGQCGVERWLRPPGVGRNLGESSWKSWIAGHAWVDRARTGIQCHSARYQGR